jgi:hypothetical protein
MDDYNFPACLSDIPGYLENLLLRVADIEEKRREFEAAKPVITRMARGDLLPNEANGRSVTIEGALEAVGEYLDRGRPGHAREGPPSACRYASGPFPVEFLIE